MEGYGQLNRDKIYTASKAVNHPDYEKDGLIFVEPNEDLRIELLLNKDEYIIVE